MQAAIKAIIFDLGNCIIGFDHRIAVNKILKFTDLPGNKIYDFFFDSKLTQDFEKGELTPLEFFQEVKSRLGLKLSYVEFLPIWNEIFFPLPGTEDFLGSLPSAIKLALLSNINRLHYEYIRDSFASTLAFFDKIILSYATGFIKPQAGIYELAIKATGENLKNLIYVDDRQDLVKAALGYGISSIQFQGLDKLREEFINYGILKEGVDVSI